MQRCAMPMAQFGIFTMKDVERLKILQDVIDRSLKGNPE